MALESPLSKTSFKHTWIYNGMIYTYNRILFDNKNGWNIDTCYNRDDPENTVNWKKPVTKVYIVNNPIYNEMLIIGPNIQTEQVD